MNKKICIIAFLLLFAVFVNAEISVERQINSDVRPGEEIDIQIVIDLDGLEPSSVIVKEVLPSGWELVDATPNPKDFEGAKKWLIYGNMLKDKTTIKYTLKAPENFSGSANFEVGEWRTLTEGSGPIKGDYTIDLAVEEPASQPDTEPDTQPTEDNTMLYVFGAIGLVIIILLIVVVLKKK